MATLLSAFVAPPCVVGKQKKSSLLAFQLQQQQQHSSLNVAVGTTTTTYSTRKLGTVRFWSSCNAKHESNNVCGESKNEKDSRVVPQRGWENRCYWVEGRMAALLLALVQAVAAPIPLDGTILGEWSLEPAEAVLYSPDTKVPRSAEVALRRAIPAVNPSMKKMQESLEDIFYLLRIPQRKPYGSMENDVKKAIKLATDDKAAILAALPPDQIEKGTELFNKLISGKGGLESVLEAIAAKDADKVSIRLASSLDTLSQLELAQATGLAFLVPTPYQQYPRLTGRATAEFTVEKGDGSSFTVATGGGPQKVGILEVVLDGYSAPLTAGNFADLVLKGAYDGIKLRSTEQAILSDTETLDSVGRALPIEILPSGEFQPLYRTTLNVQSGLGGLSFEEGQFSVFGYVTKGKELLSQLKTGDIIKSAKLVSGLDRFVAPTESG
ncbi:hypothetical protein BDL97_08G005500 [Sphagnum fallax]|nr:hypothetical protein BDL97_08G005500 [Sphagnum fallax]